MLGSPFYKKSFSKGNGNIIIMTIKCIIIAIRNKIKHRNERPKKKHWLDYAETEFDSNLISSVKITEGVVIKMKILRKALVQTMAV
jgi:hypothetical protein